MSVAPRDYQPQKEQTPFKQREPQIPTRGLTPSLAPQSQVATPSINETAQAALIGLQNLALPERSIRAVSIESNALDETAKGIASMCEGLLSGQEIKDPSELASNIDKMKKAIERLHGGNTTTIARMQKNVQAAQYLIEYRVLHDKLQDVQENLGFELEETESGHIELLLTNYIDLVKSMESLAAKYHESACLTPAQKVILLRQLRQDIKEIRDLQSDFHQAFKKNRSQISSQQQEFAKAFKEFERNSKDPAKLLSAYQELWQAHGYLQQSHDHLNANLSQLNPLKNALITLSPKNESKPIGMLGRIAGGIWGAAKGIVKGTAEIGYGVAKAAVTGGKSLLQTPEQELADEEERLLKEITDSHHELVALYNDIQNQSNQVSTIKGNKLDQATTEFFSHLTNQENPKEALNNYLLPIINKYTNITLAQLKPSDAIKAKKELALILALHETMPPFLPKDIKDILLQHKNAACSFLQMPNAAAGSLFAAAIQDEANLHHTEWHQHQVHQLTADNSELDKELSTSAKVLNAVFFAIQAGTWISSASAMLAQGNKMQADFAAHLKTLESSPEIERGAAFLAQTINDKFSSGQNDLHGLSDERLHKFTKRFPGTYEVLSKLRERTSKPTPDEERNILSAFRLSQFPAPKEGPYARLSFDDWCTLFTTPESPSSDSPLTSHNVTEIPNFATNQTIATSIDSNQIQSSETASALTPLQHQANLTSQKAQEVLAVIPAATAPAVSTPSQVIDTTFHTQTYASTIASLPPHSILVSDEIEEAVMQDPGALRLHTFLAKPIEIDEPMLGLLVGHETTLIKSAQHQERRLEGNSPIYTIGYQLQVAEHLLESLQQVPKDSDKASLCCESVLGTGTLAKSVREDPKLLEETVRQLRIAKKIGMPLWGDNLQEFRSTLRNEVAALSPGQSIFFPAGWTGKSGGHGISWSLMKQHDGKLTVRLYNTGDGVDFHTHADIGLDYRSLRFTEMVNVDPNQFTSDAITQGIFNPVDANTRDASNWGSPDLYVSILNGLGGQLSQHTYSKAEMQLPQFVGVCSMESVMAVVDNIMGNEPSAKLLRFWSTLHGAVSYFEKAKDHLASGEGAEERRRLIHDAIWTLSHQAIEASETGALTDQELALAKSLIDQMKQHIRQSEKEAGTVFAETQKAITFRIPEHTTQVASLEIEGYQSMKTTLEYAREFSDWSRSSSKSKVQGVTAVNYTPFDSLQFNSAAATLVPSLQSLIDKVHIANHDTHQYREVQKAIRTAVLEIPINDPDYWQQIDQLAAEKLLNMLSEVSKEFLWSFINDPERARDSSQYLSSEDYLCQAKILTLTDRLLQSYPNAFDISIPRLYESSLFPIVKSPSTSHDSWLPSYLQEGFFYPSHPRMGSTG